jgi:hypothetical protein
VSRRMRVTPNLYRGNVAQKGVTELIQALSRLCCTSTIRSSLVNLVLSLRDAKRIRKNCYKQQPMMSEKIGHSAKHEKDCCGFTDDACGCYSVRQTTAFPFVADSGHTCLFTVICSGERVKWIELSCDRFVVLIGTYLLNQRVGLRQFPHR